MILDSFLAFHGAAASERQGEELEDDPFRLQRRSWAGLAEWG